MNLYFCTKFCNKRNSSTLISNMTIAFKYPAKKYLNKTFLVQEFPFLHQCLQFDKFVDADFKEGKSISKFYPKNKVFLVLNIRIFIFAQNFAFIKIRGCWFHIWQWLFQIPAQKYLNKANFVLNLSIFIFA